MEDEAQPFRDLRPEAGPLRRRPRVLFPPADRGREEAGHGHSGGTRQERRRSPHQTDQGTRHRRAADAGHRADRRELRVALHELVASHQMRQVADVCDVEEHGQYPVQQGHGVQQPDAEQVGPPGERDRQEGRRAQEVAADQHGPLPHPVDPCPGREPDQQRARRGRRGQQADLELVGVQGRDRHQRQRQEDDPVAQLPECGGGEEAAEVPVVEEPEPVRPGHAYRPAMVRAGRSTPNS